MPISWGKKKIIHIKIGTGSLHEDAVNVLNLLAKLTAKIWKISETGVYQYFVLESKFLRR
jgi:hypothetical protein